MPIRNDLLTIAEVALSLGVSPQSVNDSIRRGALAAVPIDGRTKAVAPEEVERYRRENRGRIFGHDPAAPPTKGALYARAYRARKKERAAASGAETPTSS